MSLAASGSDAGTVSAITLPPAGSVILPPNASRAQIDQYIQANFGYMAWALAVPELRQVLEKSVVPNGLTMDQNTFDGLIRNTNWFKNNTQAMRSWVQMLGEDPETAQAQLDKQQANIQTEASMMGLNLNAGTLKDMSEQAIAYQWDKSMMDHALYSEAMRQTFAGTAGNGKLAILGGTSPGDLTGSGADASGMGANPHPGFAYNGPLKTITGDPFGGGTLSDYYAKVMQYAHNYMVSVSPTTAAQWAIGMSTGQMDTTAVEGNMIKLAQGKFPTLANEIASGITPSQYFDPITQDIARTLEIPPDEIDYTQPKWAQVLQYKDPTSGQVRPMTDAEAMNWARQQPEFQKTSAFAQAGASTVKSLATAFGAAKY